MTNEEKELLIKDLCARLPYGVIVSYQVGKNAPVNHELVRGSYIDEWLKCSFKPYLRPLSSMTEEECKELGKLSAIIENVGETLPNVPYYIEVARPEQIDWLNSHHFDYRGLIEKGLALEAPEGIYES